MITCSFQAPYSDHLWFCRSGSRIFEYPHSEMMEVLWEGRKTPPSTLPTSQSNDHALVCNSDSGPRTASSSLEGMLSFPAATPMILCTQHMLNFLCPFLSIVPAMQPSHKEFIERLSLPVLCGCMVFVYYNIVVMTLVYDSHCWTCDRE